MAVADFEMALDGTMEVDLTATGRVSGRRTSRPVTDQRTVGQVVDKFSAKYGASQVAEYYPNQDVAVQVALR
jgi:hypothetical protein